MTAAPLRVAVLGCSGRMGRMLARAVSENPATVLAAATERAGADCLGRDAGPALGLGAEIGVPVTEDAAAALAAADAALDFTAPAATAAHAAAAAETGTVHVIGTTGFAEAHLAAIARAAEKTVVVRAGNMSLGVNLLTVLAEKVARALDDAFDVEIVETHHNQKVDAPSGTALMLGEAAARGRGIALEDAADRGRDGITGARRPGAIGFAAVRGGDVVGEHDVIFAAAGERVVLRHIATDRMIFARGAVAAALWGRGKPPGAYEMIDVLGLRD